MSPIKRTAVAVNRRAPLVAPTGTKARQGKGDLARQEPVGRGGDVYTLWPQRPLFDWRFPQQGQNLKIGTIRHHPVHGLRRS